MDERVSTNMRQSPENGAGENATTPAALRVLAPPSQTERNSTNLRQLGHDAGESTTTSATLQTLPLPSQSLKRKRQDSVLRFDDIFQSTVQPSSDEEAIQAFNDASIQEWENAQALPTSELNQYVKKLLYGAKLANEETQMKYQIKHSLLIHFVLSNSIFDEWGIPNSTTYEERSRWIQDRFPRTFAVAAEGHAVRERISTVVKSYLAQFRWKAEIFKHPAMARTVNSVNKSHHMASLLVKAKQERWEWGDIAERINTSLLTRCLMPKTEYSGNPLLLAPTDLIDAGKLVTPFDASSRRNCVINFTYGEATYAVYYCQMKPKKLARIPLMSCNVGIPLTGDQPFRGSVKQIQFQQVVLEGHNKLTSPLPNSGMPERSRANFTTTLNKTA